MNIREWALPVYTILMQMAVGALLMLWLVRAASLRRYAPAGVDRVLRLPLAAIWITTLTAVTASHWHLSRFYLSPLAVLNWRTSWLSREIIFTVLFFALTTALLWLLWFRDGRTRLKTALGWASVAAGYGVIYSMSRIYLLPSQAFWNTPLTLAGFLLASILLGATAVPVFLVMDLKFTEVACNADVGRAGAATDAAMADIGLRQRIIRHSFGWLAATALAAAGLAPLLSVRLIEMLSHGDVAAQTSLALLLDLYRPLLILRFVALFAGVGGFLLTAWRVRGTRMPLNLTNSVYLVCLLVLVAEITGRFLFYAVHVRTGL
ncbi:MAG: dimethyl sulfoxide reductase anchor subunit [Caldilineaceae bacterium]|nr:dimethyl sulfoxide reductase anchor subunit [Caldilineaceae bacterium]